jgi:hypothetical protein
MRQQHSARTALADLEILNDSLNNALLRAGFSSFLKARPAGFAYQAKGRQPIA